MPTLTHLAWLRRALAALLGMAALQGSAGAAPHGLAEAQEIAIEAYLYAYPMVLMEVTRRVSTNVAAPDPRGGIRAPMNQFAHVPAFPDDKFHAVVRPNADTLYSSLWYDVSREPLIISVPDSGGRYYLLPILDMWTDVFTSPGSRTTGNGPRQFAIVGPRWQGKLPAGMPAYISPTAVGWMIGRTQTNGSADYAAVHKFQAGLHARPLSAWGRRGYEPPKGGTNPRQDMSAPVEQVARMDAARYFGMFAELMKRNPPHANDYPILDRMARLGLVPGQDFDMNRLSLDVQAALQAAPAQARQQMAQALPRSGSVSNGWRMIGNPIGTYGTDYLRRAVIAFAGLGANTVEDAVYPLAMTDADGKPLDSAERYVIHFDKAQLPPARSFWSLTMYTDRQFFAANPIHRFAIGDRDPLKYNADGSLDLLIQRDPPKGAESNWLPTPATGKFSMNLRLYLPGPTALDGTWKPPVIRRMAD
ncbi:conserved exported hypothetical protein [Cupriavidus phytorum]|uniref:DUF1254 domain-containing protein n=2 Tax=Cupriavidus TaxID=106589 RepID=A0A375CKY4_9BURK|nr:MULTISPECIES: DUF1254 domain-containing protein [Cupriavidus]PZX26956.1 hypothetical protein C7416_106245 [Cupriavidus alkaliphilus]SOY75031.1 conserved exported hypothetical protein [Cupriavidus taiwanensis]